MTEKKRYWLKQSECISGAQQKSTLKLNLFISCDIIITSKLWKQKEIFIKNHLSDFNTVLDRLHSHFFHLTGSRLQGYPRNR